MEIHVIKCTNPWQESEGITSFPMRKGLPWIRQRNKVREVMSFIEPASLGEKDKLLSLHRAPLQVIQIGLSICRLLVWGGI